jgi:hypothetical protein
MTGTYVLASFALAALAGGCLDLSSDDGRVTEERAFGRTAGTFPTIQDCNDAKARGDYPELATCQDQIILCPDGRAASLIGGDVIDRPKYRLVDASTLVLSWSAESELTGTLAADGTLVTDDSPRAWQPVVIVDGIGWELASCAKPWGP